MNQQFVIKKVFSGYSELSEGVAPICSFNEPAQIRDYWHNNIASREDFVWDQERIIVIIVDSQVKPIGWTMVALGCLDKCVSRISEVVRPAIIANAKGLIVIHNHPSGDVNPSSADNSFTRRLHAACELLDLTLFDHLIVCEDKSKFYSYRQNGVI